MSNRKWMLAAQSVMYHDSGDQWEVLFGGWSGTLTDKGLQINAYPDKYLPVYLLTEEENLIVNSLKKDEHEIVRELGGGK